MAESDSISSDELMRENDSLRAKLAEIESQLADAQEVLRAIQSGDVDAVVVSGPEGEQVFTLKGAEYAYRALVEALNEGAATLGIDGTVLYCNQRLSDLIGIPLEQIIGNPVINLVAYEKKATFLALFAQAQRGAACASELVFQSGQSESIPVHVSLREMKGFAPVALCLVVSDLRERKRKDEMIAAGRLSASILESAAEGIAVCNETGRIVTANNALEKVCGFNPLFQFFDAAFPLELVTETGGGKRFAISEVLGGVTLQGQEARLTRKDGRVVSLLLTVAPIKASSGVLGCVLTMTDITSRKLAEEQVKESEERYRTLFDTMGEGFCIVQMLFDAEEKAVDYRFLKVNGAFERQSGLHAAEGKLMRDLVPNHEEHWFEIYGRVALTGQPEHFVNEAKELNRHFYVRAFRVGDPEARQVAIVFEDISQRRLAEQALQQQADMLRLSFDAIIVWQIGGGIKGWNLGAERLYGYSEQEALGRVTHELLKTLHSKSWGEIEKALRKDGYFEGELLHFTKDGRAVIVSARHQLIVSPEGEELILETNRDITGQRQAENELRASEERLRIFVEHAPAALAMFDRNMCYLHVSQRWRTNYGLGDRELRGLSHYDVLPEISEPWKQLHRRGLAGEVLREEGAPFQRADGSVQWVCWEIRPWRDSRGDVGGIVIFDEDITQRKRAEDEIRLAADRFQVALHGSSITVFNQDLDLRYTWIYNPSMGLNVGEVIGKLDSDIFEHAEDAAVTEAMKREVIRSGTGQQKEVLIRSQGVDRFYELRVDPLLDGDGKIVGVNCAAIDITERKQTGEALIRSEKLASVGRMASTIAHEINNPLETIGNAVYLAMSDPRITPESKSYLELAVQELERVTHITQQTLAFHRENNAPRLVDLRKSADSVLNLFSDRLKSRGVVVKKRYSEVGQVRAFGSEIQQIISNLLSNSMDALPRKGEIQMRVAAVGGSDSSRWIRFTIADTGTGIAPERLKKVFEPFYTTKEMFGTGLGLWVTKQLVEKHGAKIRVRSKPKEGTVFVITFPAVEEDAQNLSS